jgi:type VI secretion system protein ImpC
MPGRVVFTLEKKDGSTAVLPFRLLCIADLAGGARTAPIATRIPVPVHACGCDAALAAIRPRLRGSIPDRLSGTGVLAVDLVVTALGDFSPAAIIRLIPELATVQAARQALSRGKAEGALAALTDRQQRDAAIADLDLRLAAQVDAVLEWQAFRDLEATWRGLALLVEACRTLPAVEVHVLSATRAEMEADFEDAPDATSSGLFQHIYGEFGQFGGVPWSAIVIDGQFGPGRRDVAQLRRLTACAAAAQAPILAGAAAELAGLASWRALSTDADVGAAASGPGLQVWRQFREHDDARYAVLAMPRVLVRRPWGIHGRGHRQDPTTGHLWANAAWALAARLAHSHHTHGWCSRIAGSVPIADLTTEVILSESQIQALAEAGLAPLLTRRGAGDVWIAAPRTVQMAPTGGRTPVERAAAHDRRVSSGLAGVMVAARISHHLKVVSREHIGSWAGRAGLERGLGTWLGSHVLDMDDPDPVLLTSRPLRSANVEVTEAPGRIGWYRVAVTLAPHPAWMGVHCSLSLVTGMEGAR